MPGRGPVRGRGRCRPPAHVRYVRRLLRRGRPSPARHRPPAPVLGQGPPSVGPPAGGAPVTAGPWGEHLAALPREQERSLPRRCPGRSGRTMARLPPNKGAGPGPRGLRGRSRQCGRAEANGPAPRVTRPERSQWRLAERLFKKRSAGRGPLSAVRIPPRM